MVNLDQSKSVEIRRTVAGFKNITFDERDSSPKNIFNGIAGKQIVIDDLIITGVNQNANPIIIGIQVWQNGRWNTILSAGSPGIGTFGISHAFNGEIVLDENGTNPIIRAVKMGDSSNWTASITTVGHTR